MTDERWKTQIYEPYLETWKILKLIQYADQTDDLIEQWQRYRDEALRLTERYPGNKFAERLVRMLLDAGEDIARENQKERL